VIHELKEESGYDIHQVSVLQPAYRITPVGDVRTHPVPVFSNSHTIIAGNPEHHLHSDNGYALITRDAAPLHDIPLGESREFRWLTLEDLDTFDSEIMPANIKAVCHFILTNGLEHWVEVPSSDFSL
jgi:hypothetical protein